MSRYRFALRPKWIASHLFILALMGAMIVAGFWQLSRLHQKRAHNSTVEARTAQPVAPVTSLGLEPGHFDAARPVEFRPATATGHYLADQEVLVRSRSRNEAPGSWVLTPLDLGGGRAVVVNRGWIPNDGALHSVPDWARAPSGEVTVEGYLRKTETRGRFGPRDPATGRLGDLARADVARLDHQVPEDLLPVYLQLQVQRPAPGRQAPVVVDLPALDEGPHFSYAIQWFTFTGIALVGYPLILRRRAREIESEALQAEADPDVDSDSAEPGSDAVDPNGEGNDGKSAEREPATP